MIDVNFILDILEGTVKEGESYIGHVPLVGRSGVTIANGFDLGQHNKQDLLKYNLGEELNKKLEPFLLKNLSNTDAKELQSMAKSLVISEDEAKKINSSVLNWNLKQTEKEYNDIMANVKDSNYTTRFAQLPSKLQTILVQNKYLTGNIKNYPMLYNSIAQNDKSKIVDAINKNKKYNDKRKEDLINYLSEEEIEIQLKEKPQVPVKKETFNSKQPKGRTSLIDLY